MNKQHKWHKEIKAWADGAEIEARFRQWLDIGGFQWTEWQKCREPFWHNDEETEYRIKPQLTISYKETIIERLRNDDEFWNEVFSAYDKQCDKQEPQPKKPKYLYVYKDSKANMYFRDFNAACDYEKYIGKIKLEDKE